MKRIHTGTPRAVSLVAVNLGIALCKRKLFVSVAESCTGGMVGAALTSVSGSSAYFAGGIVAYTNEIKRRVLGVPESVLNKKGAVSAGCVEAMAMGVQKLFRTECSIAVSGIAGPDGGTKKKPVGLVYVGIAAGKNVQSYKYLFKGNRAAVREQAALAALEDMYKVLS
jgi:PncC family amidohydrolase